jgi:hypothetical protein
MKFLIVGLRMPASPLLPSFIQLRNDARAPRGALVVRPFYQLHAYSVHSSRGGSNRSAVQLNGKRLARALLLLARYAKEDQAERVHQKVSQEMLAEMIGTSRSRVNLFMNKFRQLGFIEYNGGIKINKSLLTVVLHE